MTDGRWKMKDSRGITHESDHSWAYCARWEIAPVVAALRVALEVPFVPLVDDGGYWEERDQSGVNEGFDERDATIGGMVFSRPGPSPCYSGRKQCEEWSGRGLHAASRLVLLRALASEIHIPARVGKQPPKRK